ncbi:MAG: acyltransferase [Bacteroidota bacterium]
MNSLRIDQLTFTRFVAAISIVIFHYGRETFLFTNDAVSFIFQQANIGVSYFYILSGFVMVIAYHHKIRISPIQYLKNRFARIYPLYLFAIGLCVVCYWLLDNLSFVDFVLNLFLVQAWVPGKALTFTFTGWSLSVELFFYVLFPYFFNKIYSKINLKRLIWGILLFWLVSQIVFHWAIADTSLFMERFFYYLPALHLNEFLIGNLAGILFVRNKARKPRNYDLAILGTMVLMYFAFKYDVGLNFHNGLFAIFFVPFIYLLSLNSGFISQIFKTKPLIFLGEISYGIYILQFPIWSLVTDYRLNKYLSIEKSSEASFYIKLAVLIFFSTLSYLWIERPMRRKIKSLNMQEFRMFKWMK